MKIIHTSDWHLGKVLYNQELTPNHEAFFQQLYSIVQEQRPNALLISGDIYETSNPSVFAQKLFHSSILRLHNATPQMKIIIISGNHDSAQRVSIGSDLWRLANVHLITSIHTLDDRSANYDQHIIPITNSNGDTLALVGAIPFAYEQNFPKATDSNNRILAFYEGLCQRMHELNLQRKPQILMGHLTISGDLDFTGHKLDAIGGMESLDVSNIVPQFDYLALGHIHHAQFIHNTQHKVRYCGTPIAVSFDEDYNHSVSIVTFDDQNHPIVEERLINTPHQLETIPNQPQPFDEALKELASYPSDQNNFLRLNVLAGTAPSDAMALATEKMEGKKAELLYINYTRIKEQERSADVPITLSEFKELTPLQVAKRYLGDRFTEEMENTFNEVLQHLND